MRKLLLPETVEIVQQAVPSDLPEQLAVTQPSTAQAVLQDLFSGGKHYKWLRDKAVLPMGVTCVLPAALWWEGDRGQGLLRCSQLALGQMQSVGLCQTGFVLARGSEDPITEHKGGDEDRRWRNEDELQLSLPCAWLAWVWPSENRAEANEE